MCEMNFEKWYNLKLMGLWIYSDLRSCNTWVQFDDRIWAGRHLKELLGQCDPLSMGYSRPPSKLNFAHLNNMTDVILWNWAS